MSSNIKDLLNSLNDGVVMLAADGHVRFFNEAARQMTWLEPGQPAPWAQARRSLEAVVKGYARTPARITLKGDNAQAAEISAVLLEGFSANDYLLVMHNDAEAAAYRNVTQNLFEFLRTELRESVDAVAASVGLVVKGMPDRGAADLLGERLLAARKCGAELVGRLEKLAVLGDVFARERLHADERITVPELIEGAWNKISPIAEALDVRLSTVGITDSLPPLYGSESWLVRALSELLENAIRHSGRDTQVEVEAHQSGMFAFITVRNHGHSPVPKKPGRHYLAFVPSIAAPKAPKPAPGTPNRSGLGVGLALVERILELHGGHLRVGDERDDSTAFVMELPTGAPTAAMDSLELQQAQRYALDMAALIARQQAALQRPNPR
ncbi:MAG: ATP-binding protein [Burkholderiales bacterium]